VLEHTALEQTYLIEGSLEDAQGSCAAGDFVWRPGRQRPRRARAERSARPLLLHQAFFTKPNRFFNGTRFFTADE
jgi:anti-sigma factor ChrR (cupin superfamily)